MKDFRELVTEAHKQIITEKVDKQVAKKISFDEGIQMAIHDAIDKHYKGKSHEALDYDEYYDLYAEVAQQVSNTHSGSKLIKVVNKLFGTAK
jgi:hypothetical protein